MKKTIMFTLLFALFFIQCAHAELSQYSVRAEVSKNLSTQYQITFILVNHTGDFSFFISDFPQDIAVNASAKCFAEEKLLGMQIKCNFQRQVERETINVGYMLNNIKEWQGYFIFTDKFVLPEKTRSLFVMVTLPEGMGLIKRGSELPYNPASARIMTDQYARKPILLWEASDLDADEVFDISVAYENIINVPAVLSAPLMVLMVAIAIVFAFGFYNFYFKSKIKIAESVMKSDERKIMDAILKHGNGVNQKIIVRESGYSKAKVSKVLKSLADRGLVKLERIGRFNKIYLK